MEKKDRRKTGLLLSVLGVLSLVLITAGVTYAFFSYAKEGQTENVITTGTIQFTYNEQEQNGEGINIQDALPITDEVGKALGTSQEDPTASTNAAAGKVFHFSVTSLTPTTAKIPYVVTVKKSDDSSLSNGQVKIYLEATDNATSPATVSNGETVKTGGVVKTFAELPTPSITSGDLTYGLNADLERIIYNGEVPAGRGSSNSYTANFVLRMWLSGDEQSVGDYSPYEFMKKTVKADSNKTFYFCNGAEVDQTAYNACDASQQSTKVVPMATNTTAIKAEDEITNENFITSAKYYALGDTIIDAYCSKTVSGTTTKDATLTSESACTAANTGNEGDPVYTWVPATTSTRGEYERIAYVGADKTVYTLSQAVALGATVDQYGNYDFTGVTGLANTTTYTQTEQYYQINSQGFTVKVNVYAQGAKVVTP